MQLGVVLHPHFKSHAHCEGTEWGAYVSVSFLFFLAHRYAIFLCSLDYFWGVKPSFKSSNSSWYPQSLDENHKSSTAGQVDYSLKILGPFDTADNLTPRTIWHFGQFDTIMASRTIWHHEGKEDNLTPRTIWHLGQFDTIMQNRTIWHHHAK